MPYGIEAFVEDLKRLNAANASPKEILPEIAPLAARLSEDQSWVQSNFYDIDENQGIEL